MNNKVERLGLMANFMKSLGWQIFPAFTYKTRETSGITSFCIIIRPFKKYKLEGEINETTLTKFISDFKAGALNPFYKSHRIPEVQKTLVREVVGLSFKEEVLDNDRDVLVLFYSFDHERYHIMT